MITEGATITITPSAELDELRLSQLAGRTGLVIEDLTAPERNHKGYMVLLTDKHDYEYVWFIPQDSAREV